MIEPESGARPYGAAASTTAQPLHAGSDAGPALLGVDDHLVELLGGDEQLGGQLGHRAVAGGLRGDAHAVAGRELHGLDDVLGVEGGEDGGRPDRDGEVPRRDEGVVRRVAGHRDGADRECVQLRERYGCGAGLGDGHCFLRWVVVDPPKVHPDG